MEPRARLRGGPCNRSSGGHWVQQRLQAWSQGKILGVSQFPGCLLATVWSSSQDTLVGVRPRGVQKNISSTVTEHCVKASDTTWRFLLRLCCRERSGAGGVLPHTGVCITAEARSAGGPRFAEQGAQASENTSKSRTSTNPEPERIQR